MTNTKIDYSTAAKILHDTIPAYEKKAGKDHYYQTTYRNNNDSFFGSGDMVTRTQLYGDTDPPQVSEVTHDVDDLQAGVQFLNKLTDGKVWLVHDDKTGSDFIVSDGDRNVGIPMVHVYQIGENGEDIEDIDFAYGRAKNQYIQQTYRGSPNLPSSSDKCYPMMDHKVVYNPECGAKIEILARLAEGNYERVAEIRHQIDSEREKLHRVLKTKPDALDLSSIAKFLELQATYAKAMEAFNQSMKMYYDHV